MSSIARIRYEVQVQDAGGLRLSRETGYASFAPGAGANGKQEDVTLAANAFTALSPPAGAKAICVVLGTAVGLTLKGITGDAGIPICPTANPLGLDLLMPLGAAPGIGITSSFGSNQVVTVIWL